jgi:hypothetical protein
MWIDRLLEVADWEPRQADMSTSEFIYRVVADPEFEPFSIAALVPEPFFTPAPGITF